MNNESVFINCPYDVKYQNLLRHILFTVRFLGYNPRFALETTDCSENRLGKIQDLIVESKYSIHDISRMIAKKKGEFARMNLPFELGMDIGCKKFSCDEQHTTKLFLILETKRYDYLKSLSDLAGFDIKSHQNRPLNLTRAIRDWFVENHLSVCDKSPQYIVNQYTFFYGDLYLNRRNGGYTEETINDIPLIELLREIDAWIAAHPDII